MIPTNLGAARAAPVGDYGSSHGAVVLHIAVDVVGYLVIDGNVIHLADGKSDRVEPLAVYCGNCESPVVANSEVIRIFGVHPDVMVVSTPADLAEGVAAIERDVEAAVSKQDLVLIAGRDCDADVVASATDQSSIPACEAPVFATVVGTPEGALFVGFDECIEAV